MTMTMMRDRGAPEVVGEEAAGVAAAAAAAATAAASLMAPVTP